jgi:UTP--glucose-1-phosphate uridylyltransferase
MQKLIKKVILPVAGNGTRLFPLTLHLPKPMIGILDKPMIHYAIKEVYEAGLREAIFVTGRNRHMVEEYLPYASFPLSYFFTEQENAIGNADAIYQAQKFLESEPVAVVFPDDILVHSSSPLGAMLSCFEEVQEPILLLERVPMKDISKYGVVKAVPLRKHHVLLEIKDIVEKPSKAKALSNLAVIGRYIITPRIFELIKTLYPPKAGVEIGLTDALRLYLKEGGKVYGWLFPGLRFDCGSKLGLVKAQIYFGLNHPHYRQEVKKYLRRLMS